MGACGLYLGQQEVGKLLWSEQAGRLQVQAACPKEDGWIYRLVLQTETAEQRLGVMMPEGERFALRRELPAGQAPLRALIDRTLPGEAHLPGLPLAFSAFSPTEEPELGEGLLSAWWAETQYFLFPFQPGKPCPQAHFLCLTTPILWKEQSYGLFCRREGGYLPLSDRLCTRDMLK